MPKAPSTSPATGNHTTSSFIHTTSCNFVDNAGRTLLLRGVNLSGSSKAPVGHPSYRLDDFWETAEAGGQSFVGQPLNLDDGSADVHLARLRGWGFNMLRYPVAWEALEHEGPGKYDHEFMDYTIRVLQKCKEYGFKVYMDPHQDTWSRFSGGSGAPFWTLAACGIDPRKLTATQSAIIHCEYPLAHTPDPAALPAMIWSTNYGRLLSQTVFTLFFAGRTFAPRCMIDGKNIQDYLQEHYIAAMGHMADRIRDTPGLLDECVIGWDSLNEPFEGLCGWEDLAVNPDKQGSTLKKGSHPTPLQSLRLGMGQTQTVQNWKFGAFGPSKNGEITIDPKGQTIWADPSIEDVDGVHPRWGWKRDVRRWKLGSCVWAQHGVWDIETGYCLRPDYFRYHPETGDPVEFIRDFWRPHFVAFAKRIRQSHPEAILFVQPPVFAPPPEMPDEDVLRGRAAYSAHYYDGLTLITRHWNWFNADALGLLRGKYTSTLQAVKIGQAAIRRSLQEQLAILKGDAEILGDYPTIIGEIGTPFDMDQKRSYGWTDGGKYKGDYSRQQKALDASLNGGDGKNGLNWTVWTYCTDHSHDWGDGWNMEDLSLWSVDDMREEDEDEKGLAQEEQGNNAEEQGEVKRTSSLFARRRSLYKASSGGGESQAVLIRRNKTEKTTDGGVLMRQKNQMSTVSVAAASQLSLATAASSPVLSNVDASFRSDAFGYDAMSSSMSVHEAKRRRTMWSTGDLSEWRRNPYGFLTNGARAVRAFARPWPQKTVGVPVDIRFDVSKSQFKLTVRVTADDRIKDEEEEEGGEKLATEIYVPLVHYASARVVRLEEEWRRDGRRAVERRVSRPRDAAGMLEDVLIGAGAGMERRRWVEESDSSRSVSRRRSVLDLSLSPPTSEGRTQSNRDAATSPTSSSSVTATGSPELGSVDLFADQGDEGDWVLQAEDLLDVEVAVSAGQWQIEGQILKWWYQVPPEGQTREYTIEIKRRGGAIKPVKARRAGTRDWCSRMCDELAGCCIM